MIPSTQEIRWLKQWLEEHKKKLPGVRGGGPFYEYALGDLDEWIYGLRREAVYSRDQTWSAICERVAFGTWPKMKSSSGYWLRQRWLMAERYCLSVLHANGGSETRAPQEIKEALKWLLLDLWDQELVDIWIRENARDCVCADHHKSEDAPYELEQFLRKLESSTGKLDQKPPPPSTPFSIWSSGGFNPPFQ